MLGKSSTFNPYSNSFSQGLHTAHLFPILPREKEVIFNLSFPTLKRGRKSKSIGHGGKNFIELNKLRVMGINQRTNDEKTTRIVSIRTKSKSQRKSRKK